MPDVKITVGDRDFDVACAEGEEHFLKSAAVMLDAEAQVMVSQIRHLTESRMLLMAGLMLADKTAGLDDQLKVAEARIAELEQALYAAQSAEPQVQEVVREVVPDAVTDTLKELAARAEAIADEVEAKAG